MPVSDDVPAVANAEGGRSQVDAPGEVEPAADLAHRGIDDLELFDAAEPRPERTTTVPGMSGVRPGRRRSGA